MTRRTRHRPARVAISALKKAMLGERPKETLNRLTPDTLQCSWPGCNGPMHFRGFNGQQHDDRYGILCFTHAVDVAIAVIQHNKALEQVSEHFARMQTEQVLRAERCRQEDEQYEAEKAALRQDRDGFVYYIRIGDRIKVGYSADVKQRMRAYPPGSALLAVEPGDRDLERQRHQQFTGSRAAGREWFRPTPDIFELVDEIVATHGEPKRFAHHYRRNEQPVKIRRPA